MRITSHSVQDTLTISKVIARNARRGDIICLFGQLGSGKTVLAKGIASGLGINSDSVVSPSFVLLRQYPEGKLPFYHFDLYRLEKLKDISGLGYEEYFYDDGLTVVEWADRLGRLIPQECLKISLSVKGPSERLLEFAATGSRHQKLLKDIDEDIRH